MATQASTSSAAAAATTSKKRARTTELAEDAASRIMGLTVSDKVENMASTPELVLGTHSGKFHCDEALACGMLLLLPKWSTASIVRSRDAEQWAKANALVDVGGVYDVEKLRFDHHQREFTGTMNELGHDIKLSSAGLVYRHFGKDVIKSVCGDLSAEHVDIVYSKVYEKFIMEVDAIDNGVNVCDDGVARYSIHTTLSNRVGFLNPSWNEPTSTAIENELFKEAILLTTTEFVRCVKSIAHHWLAARVVVETAFKGRAAVHESGGIMVLDTYCPWKDHLFDLEEELAESKTEDTTGAVKYIVYPDSSGKTWRLQCAPLTRSTFTNRKSLPKPWCGVRDEELSKLAGIPGCVFVHAAGFIGGNKTKEGVLAMAKAAVEFAE